MKKRIVSIILILCTLMCLVPTAVLAADEVSAKVNGIAVPAAGGSITGKGISGSIVFDASAKTLTLENATISVTTENIAIEIRSGIDTLILKGKNEIKWADESDKKTNLYAISASSSSFLIKGNSREDSLTVTLPGTTGGYKYAYAISMGNCEIRSCSLDITVIGGMQNAGDNVAIRIYGGNFKIKDAALNLTVGKDRKGNVQKTTQGACVYATGRISIENSYINAGIHSALGQGAAYYATLQGQGGITCTDSEVYAESDVLKAGRTICLDGADTTFSVKNSIFKTKSNQYAVYGYNHAKPTFESSLVELESEDVVMRGPTFGTISGFTKITATDKNSNVTTYNPGDDLSTLSTDSRKVVIESQIHSHCFCGGEIASEEHTVHSPLIWTPWTKTDSLPTAAGNYYLTGNVILKSNSDYSMPDGVQICLNGYGISGADGANKPKLYANSGTLTVTDCGTKGSIGNVMMSSGKLFMYGGSIPAGSELVIGKNGAFNAVNRVGIGGKVTNGGVIFGGIFDGEVVNDGGTLKDGIFNGRIDLKSGNVIGGIYYGRVTYGGAVIHDSACRYLTFDTDGGSAIAAQRILRGQKATPPTENPVKTGYIFGGWTGFDYTKPMLENAKATAIWTVCDHSGNTTQLSCTDPVACSACGGTIAALGHDFSASVWQHDNYTHWKKCARCDARNEENPHDWDSGKVTVPSTCLTEGNRVFTCDECGATKNEPIQASGHSWDQAWQHNATHHWHECLNADCDVKDNDSAKDGYGAHAGGTAACTAEAICEYCHQSYGEKDPANHEGGTQEWTIRTAYVHEQKWSCCGAVIVASEDHEWSNGVCSECGYACLHDDTDKNHICDICSKVISNHEDADNNHVCDYCEKVISNHEDTDKNHVCDYCEKVISNHEDADKNHVCDYCEKVISNHEDADKNHICDYCEKVISNHEDADKNHVCDYCEKVISNHEDADKDHVCDYCEKVISNHEDADKDHICDYCDKAISNHEDTDKNHVCDFCEKVISNHIGGTATCHTKAICEICRNGYGEFDETNHDGGTVIRDAVTVTCTENGYTGDTYCTGCDKLLEHGDVIEADGHAGGKATCTEKAVCDLCGESYGELDSNNHADLEHIDAKAATEGSEGNTEYWHCEDCGKYYADAEASKEITAADTVTKKLPAKTADTTPANDASDTKAPGTGDTTSAVMTAALLMSSMAAAASVFSGKKKKHSER